MLTKRERQWAEWYARLGSIADLAALEEWEKFKLVSETNALGIEDSPLIGGKRLVSARAKETWTVPSAIPFQWKAIAETHTHVRQILTDVFAGKIAVFPPYRHQALLLPERHVALMGPAKDSLLLFLVDLTALFRCDPLPFRQCGVCDSFFVPIKRQVFCSLACKRKAADEERKESRRTYMQKYMTNRRKRQKKQSATRKEQ